MAGAPLRPDAWGFKGSTYTDTKTGHAQGHDGSDGDDEDDDDVGMSTLSPPCGMGSIKHDGGTVFVLRRRWLRFE